MSRKTWVFAGPIAAIVGVFLLSGAALAEATFAETSCADLAQPHVQNYGVPACQRTFQPPVTQSSLIIGGSAGVTSPTVPVAASYGSPAYAQTYQMPTQATAPLGAAQRAIQPTFGGTIISVSKPYTLDTYGRELAVLPASRTEHSVSLGQPTQSEYLGTSHAIAPQQVPAPSASAQQSPGVQIGGTQVGYYNAPLSYQTGMIASSQQPYSQADYQQAHGQSTYQPLARQGVYVPQQAPPVQHAAAAPRYDSVSSPYQPAPQYQPSQQYQSGVQYQTEGQYQTDSYQVQQQAATQQTQLVPQQISTDGIYVQIGAFSLEGNTRRVMTDLIAKGFHSTSVRPVAINGRNLHRVRIGPFADMQTARTALQSVQAVGYPEAKIF